jgi:hypothetical protein
MSSIRKKFLDQKLVNEFALFRALKNKIEKWLKECREQFLAKFEEGALCPTSGPFILVAEPGEGRIDWKKEFFSYLVENFKLAGSADDVAETLAVTKMASIEKTGERKPIVELSVKTNPSYSGKAAAIVKKLDSRNARGF